MRFISTWLRPPRLVLTLFLGVTASLLAATGWLAGQVVAQDRIVLARQTSERLDSAADAAVAELRHRLDILARRLASAKPSTARDAVAGNTRVHPSEDAPGTASGGGSDEGSDNGAAWVTVEGSASDVQPVGRIIYYPDALLASARSPAPGDFASADALEYQRRDLPGALAAIAPLARSADSRTRAGALLRVARMEAKLHHMDRALTAYDDLAALNGTTMEPDMPPAGLLGHYGRCVILAEAERNTELVREAAQLERDLDAGTWRITKAQYEQYLDRARSWQRGSGANPTAAADDARRLSAALAMLWYEWQNANAPADGVRLVRLDGVEILAMWRRSAGRVAAVVALPQFVERVLVAPVRDALARHRATISLAGTTSGQPAAPAPTAEDDPRSRSSVSPAATNAGDHQSSSSRSSADHSSPLSGAPSRQVVRTSVATGLPWTLQIADADPAADAATAMARRRVLFVGLSAIGLFVLAGTGFIVRAVNREVEVLRLQTDFVAAVSHEFRTPLTSIAQVSEALIDGRVPAARLLDYYHMQQRDSDRLRRLVESLLDFGRMESGARQYRMEPLDLAELARSTANEFAVLTKSSGCQVDVDVPRAAAAVSGDREALGRAIWNLLDNAVKYSPACKTVWLTTTRQNEYIDIAVRDCGVGIPSEEQRRIFNKFTRGANAVSGGAKGTGLGLAMVRHIVRAHGGDVRVESRPGEGSTFTISIPLSTEFASGTISGDSNGPHPDC